MSQSARVEPTSSVRCGGVVLTGHRSLNKFVKGSSILLLYFTDSHVEPQIRKPKLEIVIVDPLSELICTIAPVLRGLE